MKKGYKRLLLFELIIFIILILNSFVSNILSNYFMFAFLLIITLIFRKIFGFEKNRNRYSKDIIFDVLISLLVFFLLYYLLGIVIGFARTGNYYTINNIFKFIIPIILIVIIKEILRYMMLKKAEGSKIATIVTCLLFILIDITSSIYYGDFNSNYEKFIFLALTLLPTISSNIVCTYVTKKVGFVPVIIYLLITRLYLYLIPIVPNPNEYISSIVNFLLPIIVGYRVYSFFQKDYDAEVERTKHSNQAISLIIPGILIIFLVYITSGYFHYYAIAIASGSMSPTIKKGDAVIIEKIDGNYENLKEGQVIAYKYDDVTIVHRLYKIMKIGDEYFFYTKGDANASIDNWVVEEDMIIGTVSLKVPFIGMPTVWLNEL